MVVRLYYHIVILYYEIVQLFYLWTSDVLSQLSLIIKPVGLTIMFDKI